MDEQRADGALRGAHRFDGCGDDVSVGVSGGAPGSGGAAHRRDGLAHSGQRRAAQPDHRHAQYGGFYAQRGAGDQPLGLRGMGVNHRDIVGGEYAI